MAIELSTTTRAAQAATSHSVGTTTFELAADKSLKIETFPDGEDYLDVEVPAGKVWLVTIDVAIAEKDA